MAAINDPSIDQIVRQQRRLSGLSQAELAKLAGVGKTVVFDLEHGKRSIQLDTLLKILSVLNIKIAFNLPPIHVSHMELQKSQKPKTPM